VSQAVSSKASLASGRERARAWRQVMRSAFLHSWLPLSKAGTDEHVGIFVRSMQRELTRPYVITVGQPGSRVRRENTRRPSLVDSSATAGYSCVEQRCQQNCACDEAAPTNYVSGPCNRQADPRHRATPSSWRGPSSAASRLASVGEVPVLQQGRYWQVCQCGSEFAQLARPARSPRPATHTAHTERGAESRTGDGSPGSLQLQESPVDPALFRRVAYLKVRLAEEVGLSEHIHLGAVGDGARHRRAAGHDPTRPAP
jgi:hypothetical protein